MSTTIEERVVGMRFDNSNFEKNVQTSMKSIEALNKSLDGMNGAPKGLKGIDDAIKKVDVSPIGRAVEEVSLKFSAMEIMAITALSNITNKAINMGTTLLKSMTIDNISLGWQRYADKTTAVQTIMAATADQFEDTGKQMAYVEKQLNRLSWFTDETSFKFTEMVANIGKFTSNGVKLDDAATSMQGIALWAAKSGANANQASHAMYNLSQAMGMGKLSMADWRSIENANMATMEFQKTAINFGVELGKLRDIGNGFVQTLDGFTFKAGQGFRDSLTKGWLDKTTMTKTFNEYGRFTNELYKTINGTGIWVSQMLDYIDDYREGVLNLELAAEDSGVAVEELREMIEYLADESFDFGRSALRFGQEAKTFKEAFDYVGEAVSSGWMKTFELIFGNYEKAKRLWTDVANELYEIFVAGGEERNEMLSDWVLGGGRDYLFSALNDIYKIVKGVAGAIGDAFRDIFPKTTAADLYVMTRRFKDLTSMLKPTEQELEAIRRGFRGLFSILGVGKTLLVGVIRIFTPFIPILRMLGMVLTEVFGKIGDALTLVSDEINAALGVGIGALVNMLVNALVKIIPIVARVVTAISRFIYYITSAASNIPWLTIATNALQSALALLSVPIMGIISAFKKLRTFKISDIPNLLKSIGDGAKNIFNNIKQLDIVQKILEKIKKILDAIKEKFEPVVDIFEKFIEHIKEFIERVKGGTVFETIASAFGLIGEKIKELMDGKSLKEIFEDFKKAAEDGDGALGKFINRLREFTKQITPGKLMTMVFSLSILAMSTTIAKAASNLGDLLYSVKNLASKIGRYFYAPRLAVLEFAKAVALVAVSMKILSTIPAEDLKRSTGAVIMVLGMFVIMEAIMGGVSVVMAKLKKDFNPATMSSIMQGVGLFAAGMAVMVFAMSFLAKSGPMEDAGKKIGAMVAVIVATGVMATLMSRFAKPWIRGSISFLIFALGMSTVIGALKKLNDLDVTGLEDKMKTLGVAMAALGALAFGLGNIRISSVIGLLMLSTVIEKYLPPIIDFLKKLSSEVKVDESALASLEKFQEILITLGLLFSVGVMAVGYAIGKASKALFGLAVNIAVLGLVISAIGGIAMKIKEQNWSPEDFGNATGMFTALIGMIAIYIVAAGFAAKLGSGGMKMAGMLLSLTITVGVLSGLAVMLGQVDTNQLVKGGMVIGGLIFMLSLLTAAAGLTKNAKTGVVLAATIAIVILATELIALTGIPWNDILPGVVAMSAIMLAFAASLAIISSAKTDKNVIPKILMMILVAGVAVAFTLVIKDLEGVPWQNIVATGIGMGAALLAFAGAVKLIAGIKIKDAVGTFISMIGLVFVIGVVTAALMALAKYPWEALIGAGVGLAATLVAVGVAMKLVNEMTTVADIGTVAMIAAITMVLAAAITYLSTIPWQQGLSAAIGLGIVMVSLGVMVKLLDTIVQGGMKAVGSVLALVGGMFAMIMVLNLMIPTMTALQSVSWETLGKAGAALVAFIAALAILSNLNIAGLVVGVVAMAGMAGSLIIMGVAMQMFETINWDAIAKGLVTMGVLAVVVGILGALGPVVLMGAGAMLMMGAAMLLTAVSLPIFAAGLQALADVDWDSIKSGTKGLIGFVAVMAILALIGAPLIATGIAMVILSAGFGALSATLPLFALGMQMLAGIGIGTFVKIMVGLMLLGAAGAVLMTTGFGLMVGAAGIGALAASIALLNLVFPTFVANIQLLTTSGIDFPTLAGNLLLLGFAGMSLLIGSIGMNTAAIALGLIAGAMTLLAGIDFNYVSTGLTTLAASVLTFSTSAMDIGTAAGNLSLAAMQALFAGMTMIQAAMLFDIALESISTEYIATLEELSTQAHQAGMDLVIGLGEGILEQLSIENPGKTVAEEVLKEFRNVTGWSSPWTTMVEAGGDMIQGLMDGMDTMLGALWEKLSDIGSKIVNFFKGIFEKIVDAAADLGAAFEGAAEAGGLISKTMGMAGMSAEDLKNQIMGLTGSTEDYNRIFEETLANMGLAGEEGEGLSDTFEKLAGDTEGLTGAMGGAGGAAGQMADQFSKLKDTISNQIDIFSEFNMKTEISGKQMLANMRSQIKGVAQWANNLRILAERGINQGLLQKLSELGPQGYEKVAAFVQMSQEELAEAGSLFEQSLVLPTAAAGHILNSFAMAGQNASAGFLQGYDAAAIVSTMLKSGDDAIGGFNRGVGNASPSWKMVAAALNMLLGFSIGIDTYWPVVDFAILRFTNKGIAAFHMAARQFIDGFISGLRSKIPELQAAIDEVLSVGAVDKAIAVLAISSPSRVGMWIGQMWDRGIALGILQNGGEISNASVSVVDSLVDSVNDTIRNLGASLDSEMNLNPVITPVLDLSNVRGNMSKVNGLFENRRISAYGSNNLDALAGSNGSVFNFTQNNYSPKALSRLDIYRQTNNQFSAFQRAVAKA